MDELVARHIEARGGYEKLVSVRGSPVRRSPLGFDSNEDRTGKEPSLSFVTYTDKIEVNLPMDDSLFAMPAVK